MDLISQVCVFLFGVSAIFVVGMKNERTRRWGYILGLAAQPFWYYTFITNGQYILVGVNIAYTFSWINGVRNHWRLADKKEEG